MTQQRFKVKRGDFVQIMVGKHKGDRGKVLKVLLADAKIVVEGINLVTRHIRPSATNPSGKIQKNLPIHISNVSVIDPSTDAPAKVGYRMENGLKVRFFKKSGQAV